ERVRRQGVGHEDGPVLEDGPVREVHAGTSWAWNRTTVRCASTRYARATARTCSARTFSTFARSASPNSHEPRPSPALRRMPWNVTPSCSYRAQARTCWRARASSAFGGGALWSFSTSRSSTASTRSREAARVRRRLRLQGPERLADVLHRDGGVEAADEDEGRVVRRVESQVVAVQRVSVQRRQVLLVPDRGPMVRVHVEGEAPQLLFDGE